MVTKTLDPDKRYNLVLQHGTTAKVLKGASVRSFEQDGETRWEATGMHQNRRPDTGKPVEEWEPYEEQQTVGFLPENVVKSEEVK